jgi:hypothetical protein
MTDQLIKRVNLAGYGIRLMLVAAVTVSASCGDLARSGKSPTFLIMDRVDAASGDEVGTFVTPLLSDVLFVTEEVTTIFNDVGRATIRAELKNTVTPTVPTSVNAITLTRYRVTFRRADGRNTAGVDVPYGFDGAVTATLIPGGGSQQVIFDLVRHQNKIEPPLKNLVGLGGLGFISTIAEVTFYGRDQAGNEVTISGNIDVQFGDFGNE